MDWKKDCWSKENYQDFKNHLLQIAEEEYRKFNEKIIPCDHPILEFVCLFYVSWQKKLPEVIGTLT